MKRWKLIGLLVLVLGVSAAACWGEDDAPDQATPAQTATGVTPGGARPTMVVPSPVACVPVTPEPPSSTIPLDEVLPMGKIAFVSFRDEYEGTFNREIYVISSDGSGPINLTRNSCADDEPDWSPDGSKIAWSSNRDGDYEIYVMSAEGGDVTQLTSHGGAFSPRWSPDGRLIAYSRGSIVVMNADGSDPVVVLGAKPPWEADEPCQTGGFPGGWSPDGSRIIYYASPGSRVCTMAVDGSEVATLISEPAVMKVEPVWSPDGQRVAFRSIRDGNSDVHVVSLEDGSEQRLTDFDGIDIEPEWSPDGEWIAFASNRDGIASDIYIMRADGSGVRRLTDHPAKDSYPVWSP